MPVSVGEVETVLTARDNMSGAIQAASAHVAALTQQIQQLGITAGPVYQALNVQLAQAQTNLANVQSAAMQGGMGLQQIAAASSQASGSMAQMDGIATRLVERLLVFYALKESFSATKAVFDFASEMERASDTTQMSLTLLQQLHQEADRLDVPFNKVSSAIDTFTRNISESKKAVVEELDDIGLSITHLAGMDADQRFEAVAGAINALPSPLQRTKAEFILFGTDGIDPVIRKTDELRRNFSNVISDEDIKVLAVAKQSYSNFFDGVTAAASKFFAVTIRGFGDYVASDDIGLGATLRFVAGINQVPPALAAQIAEWDKLHPAISQATKELEQCHMSIERIVAQQAEAAKAAKPFIEAWAELSTAGTSVSDMVSSINPKLEKTIEYYLSLGFSISTIAHAFPELSEAEVKAVETSVKNAAKYSQAWETAEKRVEDLWSREAEAFVTANEKSDKIKMQSLDLIAHQDEIALQRRLDQGRVTQQQYDRGEIDAATDLARRKQAIYADELKQELDMLAQKQIKEEQDEGVRLAKGQEDYDQYQQALSAIDGRYEADRQTLEDQFRQDTLDREQALADKIRDLKKKALDQQLADQKKELDEEQKLRDVGSTMTYDLSTREGVQSYLSANRANTTTYSVDDLVAYFKTHTLQQAIQAGIIIVNGAYNGLPGAATGGLVQVGEHGAEVVSLPNNSMVYPSGTSPGGGGDNITVHMYVNGTAEDMADKAMAIIMRKVKITRKFPGAT